MLVLGPGESNSFSADVEGPGQCADKPVRLPAPDANLRDRVPPLRGHRGWSRDLFDDEVLGGRLDRASNAGRRREVADDPDVALHGPTRTPSPEVAWRRRTRSREPPRPVSKRPADCLSSLSR